MKVDTTFYTLFGACDHFRMTIIAQEDADDSPFALQSSMPIHEINGNLGAVMFHNGLLYAVARTVHQIYTITLDNNVTLLAGTGERVTKMVPR